MRTSTRPAPDERRATLVPAKQHQPSQHMGQWGDAGLSHCPLHPLFDLPSEQCSGEQRDTLPLPCTRQTGRAVAGRQSCFLQHSAAFVQLGCTALIPARQAQSGALQPSSTNDKVKGDGAEPLQKAAHPRVPWVQPHRLLDFCAKGHYGGA